MATLTKSAHPILYGTLVVGTLDALDAIVFFGLRNGTAPSRIFQSIAAGLYGRRAYQIGIHSIGLGILLHYFIAFLIVAAFYLISRGVPILRRQPVIAGIVYGIAVYFVMNYAVLPLSAAGRGAFVLPVFVNGILIHAFGVGLPSAWFARD
jgi:phage shock protein PspC (stress-responsive transcriptional regulator)